MLDSTAFSIFPLLIEVFLIIAAVTRGEAEANRLRQAPITTQLLEWRRLENQRALVDQWNGELPRTILSDQGGVITLLPTDAP
jgi:hypothetical protein